MSEQETGAEKLSRVCQMISDNGQTWDLSWRDKQAIHHALSLIDHFALAVARETKQPLSEVISRANRDIDMRINERILSAYSERNEP